MAHPRVGPFVRATDTTSAIIWAEYSDPCEITLSATSQSAPATGNDSVSAHMHTVTVGGRHYAAPQLLGLQPATWYNYRLGTSVDNTEINGPLQCFRTLDAPGANRPLTLAYGSCRRLDSPQDDALRTFGSWLMEHFAERETSWPRILLLIGDQIYADEPADELVRKHPELLHGARTFGDFALMYEYAWTIDAETRQVLAVLPTYTIFDDHEIINSWNTQPTWRAKALQRGLEQVLVDGMVAYWVYQGWGNIHQRSSAPNQLLQIMQDAEQSGEDALVALRACIKREIYGETHLHWYYAIPTQPPIFVTDMRADRPAILNSVLASLNTHVKDEELARIMSREQMAELQAWLYEYNTSVALLVSSVPMLLPPIIGLAQYVMGVRLWSRGPLHWLTRQLGHIQEQVALRASFEHWPIFTATWEEMVKVLAARQNDILVLSGDVHFSYAMQGWQEDHGASLYQFVSTPLENALGRISQRLVQAQARCKQLSYGGLHTRVLPLAVPRNTGAVRHDLLFHNTLALVTLHPQDDGGYSILQEYLGPVDGRMEVLGRTSLQSERKR